MAAVGNRVFVTGMGIVSALGVGVEQNSQNLLAGKSGISPIRFLKTRLAGELMAGEVPFTDT